MSSYWGSIRRIVMGSDLILEVLDARLVELSRNEIIEELIKDFNKPSIIVINKYDLVSREALDNSINHLKKLTNKEIVFVSKKDRISMKNLIIKIKQTFAKFGEGRIEDTKLKSDSYREAKGKIIVGVLGYPNVGKSSIINALSFKKKAPVSPKAGTTHGIQWISHKEIRFLDSPGVIPLKKTDEVHLALIGSINAEKIKDKERAAAEIVKIFLKHNPLALEIFYNFHIQNKEDPYEVIEEIAISKNYLKKKGLPDEIRVSIQIIQDWQKGKLRL